MMPISGGFFPYTFSVLIEFEQHFINFILYCNIKAILNLMIVVSLAILIPKSCS